MDRPWKLLLVEDEDNLRFLVQHLLEREGFEVVGASDGPDAVDRYRLDGPFDLVILDLNLPGFHGVEVCSRIRQEDAEQRVMVCSAVIRRDDELRLGELGVSTFLHKPYRPELLISLIRSELTDLPMVNERVTVSGAVR